MAEQDSDVSLSDDDDGMTEEEKAKAFREEVESIIKISVKDQAIYKCIISELEQVRTAHSQCPVVLNQEVVRTLINLPFYSDFGVKDDLLRYGSKLEEVLERYEPLLRSLNRNKDAQLQGIEPIAGPFKELINNDCFNPEDWFTDEKVKSVTGTLRSHRLVDQVKAVELLKDIQKAIMKREISHKDFSAAASTEPSSTEESTSSSSQTTNTRRETSAVSSSVEPMETTTSTITDPVP